MYGPVRRPAASYQVLDNRIVQSCYREEIERIYNRSIEDIRLSGSELSTLDISNNRAYVSHTLSFPRCLGGL